MKLPELLATHLSPGQLQRITRYIVVGLASTGTYFAVFVATIEVGQSPVWVAACAAFVTGLGISYLGNALWTFGHGTSGRNAARFLTVVASTFTANLAIATVLEHLGVPYLVIFCVEATALTVMNYLGHMLYTFREQRAPSTR